MRRSWIAPLLLTVAACAAPALAEPPKPLLWKVSDDDNALYLLGSFHLLKPSDYPLAPSTDAAFADAERVVFELSPSDLSSPALVQGMQQAALRSDGRTLQQSLPPETWAKLEAHLASRGQAAANFQAMDAWFVSLMVAIIEMQAAGLDATAGLDKHFAQRTVDAGKPTGGLETIAQQIALFEEMTPQQQVESLQDTLEEIDELQASIEKMHALWRAGDADGLYAETGAEMKVEFPELYARVNRDRNLAWLPRLKQMLDDSDGDDTLVIVGAMHLLGDDGVVELLRREGYTVERL